MNCVYIDKNNGRLYRCIKEGNVTANTVEYFREYNSLNFDSISIPKFFKFDANGDLDSLTDFINDCISYGNNIDILIVGGNNKSTTIDAQNIKAPSGTLVHITLWQFLNLTINHLELNTDDSNTLVINKCGHNITLYKGAYENTWNIVGGYWW